ncbi:MAG: hypothetical protein HY331_10680 [Chloroflexi bacterium]|nr:hypothetical protein [Chloroflexota bacterium]
MAVAGIYRRLLTAPQGTLFDLTLDDRELAEEVAAYAAEHGRIPLRRLTIQLHPDRVDVTVEIRLGLFWSAVWATGRVWLHRGTVDFCIDALGLGRARAPAFLREQIHAYARRLVDPTHMPIELDLLDVGDAQLQAAGRTKAYVLP